MRVVLHKDFRKSLRRLTPKLRDKIEATIFRFRKDPFDPKLRNHALKGLMLGKRAFSVGGDIRVIFQEFEHYTLVIMLDIGTHNQVY